MLGCEFTKKTTNQPRNPQPSPFRAQPHEHTNCRLPQSKRRYRTSPHFNTPRKPHFYPRFKGFCTSFFFRHLERRKIQGTYFKISALYFKIYGLYFLQQASCFFQHCERLQKRPENQVLHARSDGMHTHPIPRNSLILFSGMPKLKEVVP